MTRRHIAVPLLIVPLMFGYYAPIPEWQGERPVLEVALDDALSVQERLEAIRHMGELSCDDPVADLLTVWEAVSDDASLARECGRMLARFDDRRVLALTVRWQSADDDSLGRLASRYRDEVRSIHGSSQPHLVMVSKDEVGVVTFEFKMALRPLCGILINEAGCFPTSPDDLQSQPDQSN